MLDASTTKLLCCVFLKSWLLAITMCSVSSEDVYEGLTDPDADSNVGSVVSDVSTGPSLSCRKCAGVGREPAPSVVVLRKIDAYCKECFLSAVRHKFRAAIGKEKILKKPGEHVLVAFSGGQNSAALLALVKEGLSYVSQKQLKIDSSVVIVDESGLGKYSSSNFEAVVALAEKYELPVLTCGLESGLDFDGSSTDRVEGVRRMKDLIVGMKDDTSRRDFIEKTRLSAIARLARHSNTKYIFLAETLDRLAVRVLADVSLGAGGSIQDKTAFTDRRFGDVAFLRPLRDVLLKETAVYCRYTDTPFLTLPDAWTASGLDSSIQRLIEKFVFDLAKDFPATTHTLCRTASKLTPVSAKTGKTCCFCGGKLDKASGNEWSSSSAVNAVEFSKLVSISGPSEEEKVLRSTIGKETIESRGCDTGKCSGNGDQESCCKDESSSPSVKKILYDALCFSCARIFEPFLDSQEPLQGPLLSMARHAGKMVSREKMREEIAEFLLE